MSKPRDRGATTAKPNRERRPSTRRAARVLTRRRVKAPEGWGPVPPEEQIVSLVKQKILRAGMMSDGLSFEFAIDPGDATVEDIQALLHALSEFNTLAGGEPLAFSLARTDPLTLLAVPVDIGHLRS